MAQLFSASPSGARPLFHRLQHRLKAASAIGQRVSTRVAAVQSPFFNPTLGRSHLGQTSTETALQVTFEVRGDDV